LIAQIFEGRRAFIVAGGPSLLGFDFGRIALEPTIAINRAHEAMPHASVLWWSDVIFWRRNREALLAHHAPYKATALYDYQAEDYPPIDLVHCYKFTGCTGFDADPACLRHGNNSSYAAMHLAAHLGARKIILLGVDMRHAEGRSHWHDGYPQPALQETLEQLMLPYFATLAPALAERKIEVLNASPDSALTVWPRCSIEEGLASW
jgi:hypothetical protein